MNVGHILQENVDISFSPNLVCRYYWSFLMFGSPWYCFELCIYQKTDISILLKYLLWLSALHPELQQPYQWHKFPHFQIPALDKFRGELSGDQGDAGDDTDDMPGDSRVGHHYVFEDGAAEEDVKGITTEVMNDKLMIVKI
jgi:hypothetical protein